MPRSPHESEVERQLANLAVTLINLNTLLPGDDASSRTDDWLEQLKGAQAGLRDLTYQLESLRTGRKCWTCDGPVVGRSDRVYCSAACRVEAHRGTSARMLRKQAERRAEREAAETTQS